MSKEFTCYPDMSVEIDAPVDGTLTRTLLNNDHVKVVLFGFSPGQELSEHTASKPAILHFLSGEASVTLGDETIEAKPGTWIHLAANLPHSIRTKSAVLMELQLLKCQDPEQ